MARDTSFYYAFLMLPAAKRNAIVAVWDFCRAVDDAVDEAVPDGQWPLDGDARRTAEQNLAVWRAEVARCFDVGGQPETPQGRALGPLVPAFQLPRQPFEDLIDGVAMDLARDRYDTIEELLEYCRRVASAVGLVCIEIFGCRDARSREYAINLGLALQLTNIVRDVGVDLWRGRVYLPQEDLRHFGCSEEALTRGVVTPPVRALLAFEIARAREYFVRAARELPRSDARRLVAAEIMGAIYQDILRRIEANGYDVFAQVIRVPRPARFLLALTTWARTLAGLRLPASQARGVR
ncbi:MAG TPA: presqualene diphosphate synthase HpnD [Vicinamibacterales bacterium]|nr:presqualene diphosphate synthase HpnD [Vicinamibacterales bacterium]